MSIKKFVSLFLTMVLLTAMAACARTPEKKEPVTLTLFAPEQALDVVLNTTQVYSSVDPNVSIKVSLDDAKMIAEKALSGYTCDVIIDFDFFMDQIDGTQDSERNPGGYDCIDSNTRKEIFTGASDETYDPDSETAVYAIAATKSTAHASEVAAFIEFMQSERCAQIYEECGCEAIGE